nr:AAA family ATPase [Succinimonas amylolytica]
MKYIGIGTEFFHELIENDCYYVDKTPLIRTVFKESATNAFLIMRPRRFGKTLTMSTFYDFLSLNTDNPGDVSLQEKWFKDTKIFEDKEFCSKYMGKFPVIFISLKAVSGNDFIGAYEQFGSIIFNLYNSFNYLADSPKLSDTEIRTFKDVADNEDYICDIKNKNKIKNSLSNLLMFLSKHHGINPILLIDEYDVPIAKAAHNGYYKEMIDIISPFLSNALKTNTYLDRAVLTGCLRAAKESIFTGLNNLLVCSVLDAGKKDISEGIGFTKEETQKVLSYYGLSDYYEDVKNNYDGYHFGTTHMYCPWDVMNFCDDNYRKLSKDRNLIQTGDYWINTSGNDVIEEFMGFIEPDDVDKMQSLLDGESITAEVRAALCYGDLEKHDINDFWTLLLYTGYLTFDPQYRSANKHECRLYIPNEEIRDCFKSKIMDFYKNDSVMRNSIGNLIKGFFSGDAGSVEDCLNELLAKYVSIRDFSVNAPKENYYHGFMNGLLANGTSLIEEQKSNFESGNGYIDLIIKSLKNRGVIVILELKQTADENEDKFLIAEDAIAQIVRKKYADPYVKRKDIKAVHSYGICFCKKECTVAGKKLK